MTTSSSLEVLLLLLLPRPLLLRDDRELSLSALPLLSSPLSLLLILSDITFMAPRAGRAVAQAKATKCGWG